MFQFHTRIEEIDPMDDKCAYLDQSIEVLTTKGYVEDPSAPAPHYVEHPPAHAHVKHSLLLFMSRILLPLLVSNNPILFLAMMIVIPPRLQSSLLSLIDLGRHVLTARFYGT